MLDVVRRAAVAVGGFGRLAGSLRITRQALYQWERVPSARVLEIERVSGVSRHDLRPDLYPREQAGMAPAEAA